MSSSQQYWNAALDSRLAPIDNISTFSNRTAVSLAEKRIEEEAHSLQMLVCSAKRRRNSLATVARLPIEILAHIFHLCTIDEPPHGACRSVLGRLRLTHVSPSWRETALQHPSLWSELSLSLGEPCLLEFIRRAKSVPLTLSFGHISQPVSPEVLRSLRERVPRMRHVVLGTSASIGALASLFTVAMPLLRSFEFDNLGPPSPSQSMMTPLLVPLFFLPDTMMTPLPEPLLFLPDTHRLLSFSLRRARLLGPLPLSTGLTNLELCGNDYTNHRAPVAPDSSVFSSFTDLMQTLANAPSLETLTLNHNLFPPAQAGRCVWPHEPVCLPHLAKVFLRGTALECAVVLQNAAFPPSASLHLECVQIEDPADIDRLLSGWKAFVHSFNADAPFVSVWVSPFDKGFALKAEPSYSNDTLEPRITAPSIRILVQQVGSSYISFFVSALRKTHIRTLSLGGPHLGSPYSEHTPEWKMTDWIFCFGGEVRHLRVGGSCAFVKWLLFSLAKASIFPRLRSIWLCDLDLETPGSRKDAVVKWLEEAVARRDDLRTIYLKGSVVGSLEDFAHDGTLRLDYDEAPPLIPGGFPDDCA